MSDVVVVDGGDPDPAPVVVDAGASSDAMALHESRHIEHELRHNEIIERYQHHEERINDRLSDMDMRISMLESRQATEPDTTAEVIGELVAVGEVVADVVDAVTPEEPIVEPPTHSSTPSGPTDTGVTLVEPDTESGMGGTGTNAPPARNRRRSIW